MPRWSLPIALLATYAAAQTSTTCNPLDKTCPSDPALGTAFETSFNSSMTRMDPKFFDVIAGESLISFGEDSAQFAIRKQGDSVTVRTKFYILFGRFEMIFQAASGQGIVSTVNLISDDLDEIDWEILGGNTTSVENNYYGWGKFTNSTYEPTLGAGWKGGAMGGMHNFTIDWTQERLEYIMDGEVVRTIDYAPPGKYPQTPGRINFGMWAGGDPNNSPGVIHWAGGRTDYSQGPFTMNVQSLKVVDGRSNVKEYRYGDKSGSYESINAVKGKSDAYHALHQKTFTQTAEKKWSGLSTGAKIGIACGVGGAFLLALIVFTFYCVRQRRQGKAEKAKFDQQWEDQQTELRTYQEQMKRGNFAISHMGHGEKF